MSQVSVNKFDELKEKLFGGNPEEIERVKIWEKEYRRQMVKSDLFAHPAIKDLLKEIEKRIKMANNLLLNDRELSDKDRHKVFEMRDAYGWLESQLTNAAARAEKIEATVEDELNNQ